MFLEFKRNLIKFSNYSLCVTLPKNITDQMNWHKGDKIKIQFDGDSKKIEITKDEISVAKEPAKVFKKKMVVKTKVEMPEVKNADKESRSFVIFSRKKADSPSESTLRW